MQTRFGLFSLLYARCLAHFEAISARFSDFPAPVINSKGQRSYCATKSYFLLAALLHMQKLRPPKRVIIAFKVPQINCSSFTKGYFEGIPSFKLRFPKNVGWAGPLSPSTPTSFANYRFSFSKIQTFISQNTDFYFRKLQASQNTDFHFVSFRFANYSKHIISINGYNRITRLSTLYADSGFSLWLVMLEYKLHTPQSLVFH